MYILIIANGYPSEKHKLAGIFEFDQAKALAKAKQKVVFAAIDMRSIRHKRHWGFESFERDGVQIEAVNIPCGRIPKKILNIVGIIALKFLYKKIVEKYGTPDVIHAHFIEMGYFTVKVFEKIKVPLVLTEHFSGINKTKLSKDLLKLGSFTYRRFDQVITVSNALAKNIKDNFGVKTITIPNIVDTECFGYKANKQDNGFSFVSVGSLVFNKGMDLLIQAFAKSFKGKKEVKLYIYGEGPEKYRLQKMIDEFGLKEQVILLGLAERKEIAQKMSESDCFVLASRGETFGVAYVEAMAMGLPVIATKCGGPEDFVTTQNGILIPKDNINSLADALTMMHNNISVYDRKKISDYARKRFGPDTIAEQLKNVYINLIESKR